MTKYNIKKYGSDFKSITDKIDARIQSFEQGIPEPTDLRLTVEHLDQFIAALLSRDDARYIDKELIENIDKIVKIQDKTKFNTNTPVLNKLNFIIEIISYMNMVPTSYNWSYETFLEKLNSRYGGTNRYKDIIKDIIEHPGDYIMNKDLALDCRGTVKDALTIFSTTYIDEVLKEAFEYKLSGNYINSEIMDKQLTYVLQRVTEFRTKIENVASVNNTEGILISNDMAEGAIRKVMQKLKENSNPVITGLKEMNMMIDGFYKRKLYMFGGIPNTGKTTTLGQFTIDCRKYNRAEDLLVNKTKRAVAVYITMEDSEEDIANRTVGFMGEQQLIARKSSLDQLTQSFKDAHLNGREYNIDVLIKEFPGKSASVDDMIAYLTKMEAKYNCEYVLITIDYVKRIKCKNVRINDEFLQLAEITEDLRNMSIKFNCPVVTAAQLNRVAQLKIMEDLNRRKSDTVLQLSSGEIGNSFAMVENTDMLVLINSEYGKNSGQKYMSFKKAKMRYKPEHDVEYFAAKITPMGGFESDIDIPTVTYNKKDIRYRGQFRSVESIERAESEISKQKNIDNPEYIDPNMIDFNIMHTTELNYGPINSPPQPKPEFNHNHIETAIPINSIK